MRLPGFYTETVSTRPNLPPHHAPVTPPMRLPSLDGVQARAAFRLLLTGNKSHASSTWSKQRDDSEGQPGLCLLPDLCEGTSGLSIPTDQHKFHHLPAFASSSQVYTDIPGREPLAQPPPAKQDFFPNNQAKISLCLISAL